VIGITVKGTNRELCYGGIRRGSPGPVGYARTAQKKKLSKSQRGGGVFIWMGNGKEWNSICLVPNDRHCSSSHFKKTIV